MEKPNLNYIKNLSDGDLEFEAKLLNVLQKELPLEIKEFEKSMENKDFLKSSEMVHKLKHKISILGLNKGFEEAALFENELKYHQDSKRYSSFSQVLESMMDFLEKL